MSTLAQHPSQAALIEGLRADGVTDEAVLQAMSATPRELFVEAAFAARAHDNIALPIPCAQTISQPTIVGLMTQHLDLSRQHKVLEVGAGSGYQSAILARLARRVYAIERHAPLVAPAQARLDALGLMNVQLRHGDGTEGWPDHAPFDRILVAAAAPDLPPSLLDQIADGGVMILPVGDQDEPQHLLRVERRGSDFEYQELDPVRFVPLLIGTA